MGELTKIQWTDHTFNPWEGKGKPRRLTSEANWKQPVKWDRAAYKADWNWQTSPYTIDPSPRPHRPLVFCASLADWLDDEVPIEWLARLLKMIHDTPNLDWLLLTKRPENFHDRIHEAMCEHHRGHGQDDMTMLLADWWEGEKSPTNVWIGTSVEDQKRADERIPKLLQIPARIRFLSVEPMLERVEFSDVTGRADAVSQLGKKALDGIHWVIFGGESGPKARVCTPDWIREGVRQCRAAGVAAFVKQLGGNVDLFYSSLHSPNEILEQTVSGYPDDHRARLKDKKGGDWSEWPVDLRVREFPQA